MGLLDRFRRFISIYHIVNVALVLIYLVWRDQFPLAGIRRKSDWFPQLGLTRELEIGVLALVYLGRMWGRCGTADEFVDLTLRVGQATAAALLLFTDKWAAFKYAGMVALAWFAVPRPAASWGSLVEAFTPSSLVTNAAYKVPELREVVGLDRPEMRQRQQDGGKEDDDVAWLVMVTASWSPACFYLAHLVSTLAGRFGHKRLRFARIDIAAYPTVASTLKIDDSGTSRNLPSFILFEGGEEQRRLPPVDSQGRVDRAVRFDKRGIITYFGLQQRALQAASQ